MEHRLFIALKISKKLQEDIFDWEQNFKHLPVRWVKGENLHITIIPPWQEKDIEGTIKKIKMMERFGEDIIADFFKVTYGPDLVHPRLVWASGQGELKIAKLKKKLENVLGQPFDSRPFKLHLTLARFRLEDFPFLANHELDEKISWREFFKKFVLIESTLLPQGSEYKILAEFDL